MLIGLDVLVTKNLVRLIGLDVLVTEFSMSDYIAFLGPDVITWEF